MKTWSPFGRRYCSQSQIHLDSMRHPSDRFGTFILSRCPNITLINLIGIKNVDGKELASWCPLIKHIVTDDIIQLSEYVNQLIIDKKNVYIESIEFLKNYKEEMDFSFLSACPKLNTLIFPEIGLEAIGNSLSRIKILSASVFNDEEELLKSISGTVTQLTMVHDFIPNLPQLISDQFINLIHLEMVIEIEEFKLLKKLRSLQSLKALESSIMRRNVSVLEEYLISNGNNLKYLWVKECNKRQVNQTLEIVCQNCSNLICFEMEYGIDLNDVNIETLNIFPMIENITFEYDSLLNENSVEKLNILLSRCQSSLRMITLIKMQSNIIVDGNEKLNSRKKRENTHNLELINNLTNHRRKRINASKSFELRFIEADDEKCNQECNVTSFKSKLSFYY